MYIFVFIATFSLRPAWQELVIPNDGVTGIPRQISDFRRNCLGKWEILYRATVYRSPVPRELPDWS